MAELAVVKQNITTALINGGIEQLLPKSVTLDEFMQCASTAVLNSNELDHEVEPESLVVALIECATDGLLPNNKEAAIIPYNCKVKRNGKDCWIKKAQYMPMIDGVMKRARMSGEIKAMAAKAVYQNDQFEYWMDEYGEHYKHVPTFGERGAVLLCFAYARMNNGELLIEVMTREDIDRVRAASKNSNSTTWKNWYDRMGCKSVMHRLARRLPNASEIMQLCETGMEMNFKNEKVINPEQVEAEEIVSIGNPAEVLKDLTKDADPEVVLNWLNKKAGYAGENQLSKIDDFDDAFLIKVIEAKRNAKQ